MTYIITERRDQHFAHITDPHAQAMKRNAGVFDLRDAYADHAIVCTSTNLTAMRAYQAKLNTVRGLDMPARMLDTQTLRTLQTRAMK